MNNYEYLSTVLGMTHEAMKPNREESRTEQLEALCKKLVKVCECTLTLFGAELEEGAWCGGLKPMLEDVLAEAKKLEIEP